jgi:hypothetical protein
MITNIHTMTVAIRRHLLAVLVFFGVFLATEAKAQQIYSPGLGLGGGVFLLGSELAPALQIDLGVGYENYGYAGTRGALFRLDFIAGATGDELDVVRTDLSIMATKGVGYDRYSPYARVGVGPLLSFTSIGRVGTFGVGGQGELALGFKGVIEIYGDAKATLEPGNFLVVGGTAGIRMTSYIWTEFVLEVLAEILQ